MSDLLLDYFSEWLEKMLATITTSDVYIDKIALTAILVVLALSLHIFSKKFIMKNVTSLKDQFLWKKISKRTITTLLTIAIFAIWIRSLNAFVMILLLLGIFVVFIVKGLTNNLIGYFVIKHGKYFKEGHRIEINDVMGDVVAIKFTHFELLEVRKWLSSDSNTGRMLKFPNKTIFEETIEVVGRKYAYIWHEIQFILTFESNWQEAEKIMLEVGNRYYADFIQEAKDRGDNIIIEAEEQYKPVFALHSNEDGIIVTLRYMVDYRKGTATKTRFHREILPKFHAHPEIEYAATDVRIFEM
ncbi:mechanosensitive ion channel family protein [Pseudogracilibacillus sp. ICA-222130]|uniref:mechanosensitive ion channel family protein n=1 Tax=Pseudogracilibacillus sp. ICA-222130 TaxID=3134655 RepID=UPI0030BA9262